MPGNMKKIKSVLISRINEKVKRTFWYNNIVFSDCAKFWRHSTFDMDVVNLGSSSAKAAFDYSSFPNLKAANWAMAPQTFVADYEIIRNYSSYLKKGATVIIPICPFSSLGGANYDLPDKYYTVLNIASMPHASFRRQQEQLRIKSQPWLCFPVSQLFCSPQKNINLDLSLFDSDAANRMEGWRREFSIMSFDYPLSIINKDAYEDSIDLLSSIIDFCKEKGFKPVLVLPPVHKSLSRRFSTSMKSLFIDSFVEKVRNNDVVFLDYFVDNRFTDDMFSNSFMLNTKGAAIFTKICLTDIRLV